MHLVIPFKPTSPCVGAGPLVADPCAPLVPASSPYQTAVACPARVLSVGRMDEDIVMGKPLEQSPGFCFSHAHDYRGLWRLSRGNSFDAVILHNSLCSFEMEEAAHLVRRLWPSAKILLIRSGEILLEDPLYDQRLRPPVDLNILLSVLSGRTREIREKPLPRWQAAHASGN
ncbi:MAG TPA: hypothetical protein VGL22_11190 [Terracidiphilus sp.]